MTGVLLKNDGKSDIVHADGVLAAGKFGNVKPEVAKKLLDLYPESVVSANQLREELLAEEDENAGEGEAKVEDDNFDLNKPLEEMLLPELMEKAKELNLDIKPATKKADVLAAIKEKLEAAQGSQE